MSVKFEVRNGELRSKKNKIDDAWWLSYHAKSWAKLLPRGARHNTCDYSRSFLSPRFLYFLYTFLLFRPHIFTNITIYIQSSTNNRVSITFKFILQFII